MGQGDRCLRVGESVALRGLITAGVFSWIIGAVPQTLDGAVFARRTLSVASGGEVF